MARGLQKVEISFEQPGATHYGGMVLFQQCCRKLDLKRRFQRAVRWEHRDTAYQRTELLLCLLYTIVAGLERISDTRILAYNRSFQRLLGLRRFLAENTLRRFLKSLSPRELRGIVRVHDGLRTTLRQLPRARTSATVDLDSTVLPLYGWTIQGARVGSNPTKPRRPSYHPLVAFEGYRQETVHGLLRPGDTHPASAARRFFRSCRAKFPPYVHRKRLVLRGRADAGSYDRDFVQFLDETGVGYVIVAKLTRPLRERAQTLRFRTFRKHGRWQVAQTAYHPLQWAHPHRFILVRRPQPPRQDETGQLTLWEFQDCCYHAFVSNLSLKPAAIYRFYTNRANVELDIRELKDALPLGKIPTTRFTANAVHFELILLAYDLVNWFRALCLGSSWQQARLHTIRREVFMLPARLLKIGNRNVLRLPDTYPHRKRFQHAASTIARLRIP